jgi:hypothetical protein
MLCFCMSMKSGVYTGTTTTAQAGNTADHSVSITYADGTTEVARVAEDLPRLYTNKFNAKIAPLDSTIVPSDPDAGFAAGSPRVRVTRFT